MALPHDEVHRSVSFERLFDGDAVPAPVDDRSVAAFLRWSMGLSAWKAYQGTRWALRVNPSSGNLHPTEAYVVYDGRVCHYAPREHALEERAVLAPDAWRTFLEGHEGFLVGLTSIHWREAWKYGERAFRYCQHDVGHAIGALRYAAALSGWTLRLLPRWSDAHVAALLGVERDDDRTGGAEREEPDCIALVGAPSAWDGGDPDVLVDAARQASWRGTANRLSPTHADWPIIDRVTQATRYHTSGIGDQGSGIRDQGSGIGDQGSGIGDQGSGIRPLKGVAASRSPIPDPRSLIPDPRSLARASDVILSRRSAVAFDARSSLSRARFLSMLSRLQPDTPPWDAIDWAPHVHLAVFVHRVEGLTPGVYAYLRDGTVLSEWRSAMRPEFLWETVPNEERLFLLLPTDVIWAAKRVSCDQDIAGDGFFSLGMIAALGSSLRERGKWFYRRLFWECGLIGQVLYLEAEAAGVRGTGIGCFYDDAVHEILGLSGDAWQSLYHFSMGMPVDDPRLTTERGYSWEVA